MGNCKGSLNMALTKYNYELTDQDNFYQQYLPLISSNLQPVDIQVHSTDGIIGDLLLEFKITIKDVNAVLFQAIKYLSHLRLNGHAVPGHILLISYNEELAYYFRSQPYLEDIEKVYTHSASKQDFGQFVAKDPIAKWDFRKSAIDEDAMVQLMKGAYKRDQQGNQQWTAVNIDTDDIIGWATTYYQENKQARKADFLGDGKFYN